MEIAGFLWLPVQEPGFRNVIAWMTFNSMIPRFCESQCLYRGIIKALQQYELPGKTVTCLFFEGVPATWPLARNAVEEMLQIGDCRRLFAKMATLILFLFTYPLARWHWNTSHGEMAFPHPVNLGWPCELLHQTKMQQNQNHVSSESRSQKALHSFILLELLVTHMWLRG